MCSNMGGGASKADLTGIPQSMIDRWKDFQAHGNDVDLKELANRWRRNKAESEKELTSVTSLKVGDVIDPRRMEIKDNASIGHADSHAWWNLKNSDGTTSKGAYEGYSDFTISKVEKRKDGVKLTVRADLGKQNGGKSHIMSLTRVFKDTDRVRKRK